MSNSNASKPDDQKKPDALEREVDEVRQRLSQTVDALGTRLSPGELLDQFIGTAREHGGELSRNFGGQLKQNPVPALLTTVGIAWMMAGSGNSANAGAGYSSAGGSYADDADSMAGDGSNGSSLGQAVKSKVEAGKDKLAVGKNKLAEGRQTAADGLDSARSSIGEHAGAARHNAKVQASELQQNMQQFMHEQPLVAGTLGLALGAALGALVPPTETEDKLVGSASDSATERAEQAAVEQYERGRETVKKTAEDIKQAVGRDSATANKSAASVSGATRDYA